MNIVAEGNPWPLAPDPLVTALQHVIAFCEYLEMKYE